MAKTTPKSAKAKKPPSPKPGQETTSSFNEQLTKALKNFTDPAWLGQNSALAAPYFLGAYLVQHPQNGPNEATWRGQVLQTLLQEAAKTLAQQGDEGQYYQRLLTLNYFKPRSQVKLLEELGVARATYFRHQAQALKRLEDVLVSQLNPAIRLELPVFQAQLVGRTEIMAACLASLQQGQTVGLLGLGGIGKTTLGAYLATQFAPHATFWYTFRPGLNDHLSSLIFLLGYFLHRQGASSLWLQLVADKSQVKLEIVPGLMRHDLKSLPPASLLLCFDEVDLLRPAEVGAHAQILSFLESLRGLAPLLFIGQQLPLETDSRHTLLKLARPEIQAMLVEVGIKLLPADVNRLEQYAQGNPRLVELFITLHRSGESLEDVLKTMPDTLSLELLLKRIWRRLTAQERVLLAALAVFRSAAPRDAWPDATEQATLERLIKRRLVQADHHGGVTLLLAYREGIYKLLGPELQEEQHLSAAIIRTKQSEYTAAAYHFIAGKRPQLAIRIWHEYQDQEINQGQSETALALFEQVSRQELNHNHERELLVLLRGRLGKLVGKYEHIREDIQSTRWRNPYREAQARRLEGDIAKLTSRYGQAVQAYQTGIDVINKAMLERELVELHRNRGMVYKIEKDLDQAWAEALLARYNTVHLQGSIQIDKGNFEQGQAYYQEAINLAEEVGHRPGEARTRLNLAISLSQQGQFQEAELHLQRAYQIYKSRGDKNNLASTLVNQALNYNLAGDTAKAITAAQEALAMFKQLDDSFGQAVAAQNLAEAYQSLGQLELAAQFAWEVYHTEEVITMPDCLRVLGEVKLVTKNYVEAEQFIRDAITFAQNNRDKYLEAYAWRSLGQTYSAQQQQNQAKDAFKQAIALFEALELPHEVQKTQGIVSISNSKNLTG